MGQDAQPPLEAGAPQTVKRRHFIVLRSVLILTFVYLCWMTMMAVHECGHVLHAWLSGGQVAAVYFPLLDFSRTDISPNPHPQFVAWGGPLWGCLLPLGAYALAGRFCSGIRKLVCFFAGFCLAANGAYVGFGWISSAGDAGTLLRHGAPVWTLAVSGFLALAAGLYLWHRLGPRFGLARP